MVAGATGVDCALLVVAADDGVMPQTREHAAILDLLGFEKGIVAITKADRAGPERIAAVTDEVRALLAGTSLANAPILPCSALTGRAFQPPCHTLEGRKPDPERGCGARLPPRGRSLLHPAGRRLSW